MIEIGPMRGPGVARTPAARLTERHVLALGLAVSALFVLAAGTAGVLAALTSGSPWSAIHLALAGAATVAIGAFMPHFAVTLAGTRPAPAGWRLASLGLLGAGAVLVVLGVTVGAGRVAASGAALQIVGLGAVGWHVIAPMREPLARRHPVVTLAYGAALAQFAAGIAIGGLVELGWAPVLGAWATLRATHAWLTLFGAVSLTIFATLVYLAPTVLGARIRLSAALAVGVAGMLIGPPVVAIGFASASVPVAIGGMLLTLGGALGQVAFVVDAHRRRGRFTSEHDWRRVAVGHLLAGTAWFAAAVAVALLDVASGRPLAGWSIGALGVPMIAGWMLQELVGSWTHLAPSVTPGGADRHARQRRVLAVASRSRLLGWNAGVALLWIGAATAAPAVMLPGALLLGGAVVVSVVALARALVARD